MEHKLTPEQLTQAKTLGIDLANFDWKKVLDLVKFLIALFGSPPSPVLHKVKADCHDECCACVQAASLAMQSASVSLNHVCACTEQT